MDPVKMKDPFAPRRLNKQIRGQTMVLIGNDRSSAFKYGTFDDIYPGTKFKFVLSFGGYSGRRLETPPTGAVWIQSIGGLKEFFWEVRQKDLEGNYSEIA